MITRIVSYDADENDFFVGLTHSSSCQEIFRLESNSEIKSDFSCIKQILAFDEDDKPDIISSTRVGTSCRLALEPVQGNSPTNIDIQTSNSPTILFSERDGYHLSYNSK